MGKAQLLEGEADLWDRMRAGDEEAFSQIFAHFSDTLFHYGCRLHHDGELVKDCLQDLFVNIWNRRHLLGPTTSIKYYLLRSVRRQIALKVKEGSTLSTDQMHTLTKNEKEYSSEDTLIQVEDENILHQHLAKAMGNLSERQREAIYLRFYQNMEFTDIATLLEITPRAVYKLIYRAIDILQKSFYSSTPSTATASVLSFPNYKLQFDVLASLIVLSGAKFFL
ncbi:RNA polymerase sigma factor [Rufibacter hautae]|uniref:Sigma-70 family RNA polymerase sigma factor n=1 Tax=Rufibacter hautae TaxID=2595005 RepID=A0A5B6TF76_9BACT|nr:sigma-70 family RNA polymerase sigma factor [Rufibacter hautae]KAA3438778.1 sigma-70 family RNA polymerase sigma factor [Rufibacter hautae]